jgi:hypothetical protein
MPASEFEGHRRFWQNYKWGMNDDLQAIAISNFIKSKAPKSKVEPWMVKEWTLQENFTHRVKQLVKKPVSAIRSGFFAIFEAIKGLNRG